MKKLILAVALIMASQFVNAQNTFPTTGNVGIGTTSPSAQLHLGKQEAAPGTVGSVIRMAIQPYGHMGGPWNFKTRDDATKAYLDLLYGTANTGMSLDSNGNVGIGTTTPGTKLTISGSDDAAYTGVLELTTLGGTNLKLGGNSSYSWIQSHASKPLYINQLGNNVILNSGGGNVGIGTTNPMQKFAVSNSGAEGFEVYLGGLAGVVGLQSYNRSSNSYSKMQFDASEFAFTKGNVGIGTTTPGAKLEIYNNLSTSTLKISNNDPSSQNTELRLGGANTFEKSAIISVPNSAGWYRQDLYFCLANGNNTSSVTTSDAAMVIKSYNSGQFGYIGIGTTTPDEKLAVNGSIHAKEVRVDLAGWPDYVFEKHYTGKSSLKPNYSLPTLAAIEAYTKANHHLPEVPSAVEIAANGLKLGEMNGVLLQKIEELMLYAIEQDKKQKALEKEMAELKQLFLDLKK